MFRVNPQLTWSRIGGEAETAADVAGPGERAGDELDFEYAFDGDSRSTRRAASRRAPPLRPLPLARRGDHPRPRNAHREGTAQLRAEKDARRSRRRHPRVAERRHPRRPENPRPHRRGPQILMPGFVVDASATLPW